MVRLLSTVVLISGFSVQSHAADQPAKPMQKLGFATSGLIKTVTIEDKEDHTNATCVPYILPASHGTVDGFKCTHIASHNPLAKVGILEGDILMSVDGEEITQRNQMMALPERFEAKDYSEIHVLREGNVEILTQ